MKSISNLVDLLFMVYSQSDLTLENVPSNGKSSHVLDIDPKQINCINKLIPT